MSSPAIEDKKTKIRDLFETARQQEKQNQPTDDACLNVLGFVTSTKEKEIDREQKASCNNSYSSVINVSDVWDDIDDFEIGGHQKTCSKSSITFSNIQSVKGSKVSNNLNLFTSSLLKPSVAGGTKQVCSDPCIDKKNKTQMPDKKQNVSRNQSVICLDRSPSPCKIFGDKDLQEEEYVTNSLGGKKEESLKGKLLSFWKVVS